MRNQRSSTSNSTRQPSPPPEAQIAALAYQFYVERGWQHGHDREDWLRAEAVLREQFARAESASSELRPAREIRPFDDRDNPMARGRRGSASREEVRAHQIPIAARTH